MLLAAGGKYRKHLFLVRVPVYYRALRVFNRQTHGRRRAKFVLPQVRFAMTRSNYFMLR
jgi:hypothetical protein